MPRPQFLRTNAFLGAIAALLVAGILVVALVVARPVSTSASTGPAGQETTSTRVLILGDSWTYGSAANHRGLGYAYVAARQLGWNATIDGARGSGYLRPSVEGGTFGDRIARLEPSLDPDIVIVQGSINDRLRVPNGYAEAVENAWNALETLYPDAQIVILGPAPQLLPVESGTAFIDEQLAAMAAERQWAYISPVQDAWITAENYLDVIDTSAWGANHPSAAGHAYLAERLAEAMTALTIGSASAGAQ